MEIEEKIYNIGWYRLVGSIIIRLIRALNLRKFITLIYLSLKEFNHKNPSVAQKFYNVKKFELVFAAKKRNNIIVNNPSAVDFLYDNRKVILNVSHGSYHVKKLFFTGRSTLCLKSPIKEKSILAGWLEYNCECYCLAKIAVIKLFDFFQNNTAPISNTMPANLHCINDNHHTKN